MASFSSMHKSLIKYILNDTYSQVEVMDNQKPENGHSATDKPVTHYCHLEWGLTGVAKAAARDDIIVIVDVMSFSTATTMAVAHGATIIPCHPQDNPAGLSASMQAELAVKRSQVPKMGRYSLSPRTYENSKPGMRLVLPSPNGSACCRLAAQSKRPVIIGALINAGAVASVINKLLCAADDVTIVACGEREKTPDDDGPIRFALEDYLGAGAIISGIGARLSPEAEVCRNAYLAGKHRLRELLLTCESGRELCDMGFADDIELIAAHDTSSIVPELKSGRIQTYSHPY